MLPKLKTQGRWIKNLHGQIVTLTGCNWQDLNWRDTYEDGVPLRTAMMKKYGVNSVRIHLSVDRWYDEAGNPNYKPSCDAAVKALYDNDIYCILVMERVEAGPGGVPWDWIENRWNYIQPWLVEIATRYKGLICGIDLIGEGIWNFGGHTIEEAEAIWRSKILSSAQAIHAVDPDLLILFHDIYSDSLKGYGDIRLVDDPFPEPNMMYCTQTWYHYMGAESSWANSYKAGNLELARTQLEEWLVNNIFYAALDLNLPVYIKSTGVFPEDINWQAQIKDFYNICKKYEVGWNQDVWHPDPPTALVDNDWQTLTSPGQIWVQSLEPLPTPIPPTILITELALGLTPFWATCAVVIAQELKNLGVIP